MSGFLDDYRRLPSSIWAVFLIQVIVRGGDFVFPFLALFLTRRLGLDSAHAGYWAMGMSSMAVLGILTAGRAGDRYGRKAVLGACMLGTALIVGACAFLPQTLLVPGILMAASFFQGAMKPLLSASIMDLCPPERHREGFSLSYLGVNLGVAIGPMIAGFLFERHLPWAFLGNALALLCAWGILVAFVVPHQSARTLGPDQAREEGLAAALRARPALLGFYALTFLISFAYSQTGFGLVLYTAEAFGPGGAAKFGFLMSFNAIAVLSSTAILTRLTRRLPHLAAMALGTGLYALGFGMLAFRLGLGLLIVSTFLWTLGEVVLAINTGPFIASQAPANYRGRFQALRETLWSSGAIVSPVVCGTLISKGGVHLSWSVVALAAAICSAGFLLLRRHSP